MLAKQQICGHKRTRQQCKNVAVERLAAYFEIPQLMYALPPIARSALMIPANETLSLNKKYVPIKEKIGCSVTRTTELATEVYSSERNHKIK